MRTFLTYPDDTYIPEANLTVLSVKKHTEHAGTTIYNVSRGCCDKVETMSHTLIKRKVQRGIKSCYTCSRRRMGQPVRTPSTRAAELEEEPKPKCAVWPAPASQIQGRT